MSCRPIGLLLGVVFGPGILGAVELLTRLGG
jgi:hypothetical protein